MSKEWPEPTTEVPNSELVNPVLQILEEMFPGNPNLENLTPYDGYTLPHLRHLLDLKTHLSEEGLKKNRETGGNPAERIIIAALELGVAKGRRERMREIEPIIMAMQATRLLLGENGNLDKRGKELFENALRKLEEMLYGTNEDTK